MVEVIVSGKTVFSGDEIKGETVKDYLCRNLGYEYPGILAIFGCSGNGICGSCKAIVSGRMSDLTEREKRFLSESEINSGVRLACMARLEGDAVVLLEDRRIPYEYEETSVPVDSSRLGISADIGSTTVCAALFDLKDGRIFRRVSFGNPGRMFGADVISRIASIGGRPEVSSAQAELIRKSLSDCFDNLCKGLNPDRIERISVVGNTAMEYIFLGIDPESLGSFPYNMQDVSRSAPAVDFFPPFRNAVLTVGSCLSAFIGADVYLAALCNLEHDGDLLIDLGTNGEIAFMFGGRYYFCSAAAGPAFEGAGLSCGCPAVPGAISHIRLDGDRAVFETVSGKDPVGICGSAVIDIIPELIKNGICNTDGSMNADFIIDEKTGIYLSRADVRMIQLSKAAISAAIKCVIRESGAERIERLMISGSFGYHINIENARALGIIPVEVRCVECRGNTALSAAVRLSRDDDFLPLIERKKADSVVIDLNSLDYFNDLFCEEMSFNM